MAFIRRQAEFGMLLSAMLSRHSMSISSSNCPLRKAVLTSIVWSSTSVSATSASSGWSVVNFGTGGIVSWKSNPGSWEYPFATSLTLYLPSSFRLNTHRQPTSFRSWGNFYITQVLFFRSESNSLSHAHFHTSLSPPVRASLRVKGSSVRAIKACSLRG